MVGLKKHADQANLYGVKVSDVVLLTFVDLNVPYANSKERMEELMTAVAFLNDISPTRHCAVVELPDVAKKSSRRGLADEESDVQNCLWGLKQSCESRWIMPFEVQAQADGHSARRRPGYGVDSSFG